MNVLDAIKGEGEKLKTLRMLSDKLYGALGIVLLLAATCVWLAFVYLLEREMYWWSWWVIGGLGVWAGMWSLANGKMVNEVNRSLEKMIEAWDSMEKDKKDGCSE